jgi:hypothetical protein
MSAPDQLKQPSQLPDDLKALLAELKIPTTDPILPLLAWIWKQMLDTKAGLESAKAATAAVFDNRLERLKKTADTLISVDASLKSVDEQLRAKPLEVKEQVEEELAEPIQTAVESCRKLDQLMKSLLQRLDHKVGRTQRALNFALFAAGLTGGGLLGLCLGHLFSSH